MVSTGKTGANAIFKALDRCRIVNSKYHAKFLALISRATSDSAITSDDATCLAAFANHIQPHPRQHPASQLRHSLGEKSIRFLRRCYKSVWRIPQVQWLDSLAVPVRASPGFTGCPFRLQSS